MNTKMTHEMVLKLKKMFIEQKENLIYSKAVLDKEFYVQPDDLPDEVDLTSTELETSMRMRLRNREALYLKKINEALQRIADGTFGECENCEEEIDIRRLEARPTATFCVSCKEDEERREHHHIDGHRHKSLGSRMSLRLRLA